MIYIASGISIIFILAIGFIDTYIIDFLEKIYNKVINKIEEIRNEVKKRKEGKEKN